VGEKRRVRGLGRGRRTRRSLAQGGTGAARRLNEALGAWAGVRITPMFGRWGYFASDRLFACFPLREKDHDLWIRLSREDQARALADEAIRPHRRFAGRGWIELDVAEPADLGRALRWLRRAYTVVNAERDDGVD
jgi:luciferase-like monooxygenase